jgi:hypothetical protein
MVHCIPLWLTIEMADYLSAIDLWSDYPLRDFKFDFEIPALRTKESLLGADQFLTNLETSGFQSPYYTQSSLPQFSLPPSKTLYPSLDMDYPSPSTMYPPSTRLYPAMADVSVPMSSNVMQMGSRYTYDQTRVVSAGRLQKARPTHARTASEDLNEGIKKMSVSKDAQTTREMVSDSDDEETGQEATRVKVEPEELKKRHLKVVARLRRMVQELLERE